MISFSLAVVLASVLVQVTPPDVDTEQQPERARRDTLLNQFATSTQNHVGFDLDARGEVIAVWHSRRQEEGTYGVRARRLDATGAPLGDEVQVNVTERGMQMNPTVSASPSGATWFAWESTGQDGDGVGVYARRFAPGLGLATAEIRVDDASRGDQMSPAIVALADGRALCLWTGPADSPVAAALYARFLGADGTLDGERFRIDTAEAGQCRTPAIVRATDSDSVLVVHTRLDEAGHPAGIYLRSIDASGALGHEIRVDATSGTSGSTAIEAVVASTAAGATVSWLTAIDHDYRIDWRALELTDEGAEFGPVQTLEVEGNGYTSGLAIDADGERTVIAWSRFADGDDRAPGLFVATIDDEGTDIVRVTRRVEGDQRLAIGGAARRLRLTPTGGVLVAWAGDAGLGDASGAHFSLLASSVDAEQLTALDPAPSVEVGIDVDPESAFEGSGAFETTALPTPHDPPTFDRKSVESQAAGAVLRGVGGQIDFRAFANTGWNPPDPEMAVGHDHIVAIVNGGIKIFDKQGNQLFSDSISGAGGFWGSLGASNFVFDPEAIWDPHADRYIAMAAERSGSSSYFLLAISDDADATGNWFKYRLNVTPLIGADIDSVNISVDANAIYLTGDWFGPTRFFVYIIDKASVLNGGTPVTRNLTITGRHSMGTPVNYDGNAPAQYLVWARETSSANSITIYGIQNPLGIPTIRQVSLSVPTYRRPTDPPQLGTSARPDLFEARFWNAVVRNGRLWCTHHQGDPAIQRWYEFDLRGWPASGQDPVLLQTGDIDDGSGASTFFGSLWVDDNGYMSLTCSRSSSSQFISIERTIRAPGDPAGFTEPLETVIESTQPDTSTRWGDYSATKDDPSVYGRFWSHSEYKLANWRTRIASFDLCSGSVENFCTTSPNSVGTGAVMSTTGSTSLSANDLVLVASGTAPNIFGTFFYGDQETSVATGDGLRCVGGSVWRLPVTQSDFFGNAVYALDTSNPPHPAALITAGTTWVFQYAYRDVVAGGANFNFADGLRILFCD